MRSVVRGTPDRAGAPALAIERSPWRGRIGPDCSWEGARHECPSLRRCRDSDEQPPRFVGPDGTWCTYLGGRSGGKENTFLANGLANAALNIASGEYQAKPGVVFPGIFNGYGPDITTPHGLLWYPFAWDTDFDGLSRDGVDVEWLLVIPVSDDEVSFIAANGPGFKGAGVEKLIDTFESDAVDIYDTGRSSAV